MKHFTILFFFAVSTLLITTKSFLIAQSYEPELIPHAFTEMNATEHSRIQTTSDSLQEAWVSYYASGLIPSNDEAEFVVVDQSGNIYITGKSRSSGHYYDYATIKYNSAGVEQWVARYNDEGNSDDKPSALAVDGLGNVYVTGSSRGINTSTDYATVKYNAAGIEQWIVRYNGPGNYSDYASDLALDGLGNIYVTGWSTNSNGEHDYATVKYNSQGVEQWVARYNGPGNMADWANAIVVDSFGNVFVTGWSTNSNGEHDYATVKYNSQGVEQWVARYYGYEAVDISADGSGNVYVTGRSSSDYATVKYNSDGIEQWVARYNGSGNYTDDPSSLAIDSSGNVYVTGWSTNSNGDYDYATVKYNSQGVEQWVATYNGPGNYTDHANSLAIDNVGNVYVTGESRSGLYDDYATVKYNSEGVQQWVATYNGPGNYSDRANSLTIDNAGGVYVTGGSGGDFATLKYDAAGVEQWVTRYDGPGNSSDAAKALCIDGAGNVYVTGASNGYNISYWDFATVKYDASGFEQWVTRYNGPDNDFDVPSDIAIDASGNVYVTGVSVSLNTSYDFLTVKYNADGVEQWAVRYNSPDSNSYDYANAIAVDPVGNVYVTGFSASGLNSDYSTVKYNSSGVEQWVAHYNGPGNYYDESYALVVDALDNVYVTGGSYGSGTLGDYATVKYNSSGVVQWVSRYNGQGNYLDWANAIAIDNSGNVYVTGTINVVSTSSDYATVKYNSAGVEQWDVIYNHNNHKDQANSVVVDGSGNLYVTGLSNSSGLLNDYDYATVKYNSSGVEQWIARYNGPGNSDDQVSDITVDESGNTYVTGKSIGSGIYADYDCATIKYNSSGVEQQWVARYDGPGIGTDDYAVAIGLDRLDNVFVTGASSNGTEWDIYTTIKYIQNPASIIETGSNSPEIFSLKQNYPNPFNPTTTISFSIPSPSNVSLKIFDMLGREVSTLFSEELKAGTYSYQWNADGLPSGVYFYQLQAGVYVETKKLILLK